MVEDDNVCFGAGDFDIPLMGALDTAGVTLEVAKLDLVGVLSTAVGVREGFCIDAAVGVGRDGADT